MKKTILSLAALCMLTTFSSERLMSAKSCVYRPFNKNLDGTVNLSSASGMKINPVFSLFTAAPVTYRNFKTNAGYLEITDLTTGQTYAANLPATGTSPISTGIQLTIGDRLQVTLYSGNGASNLTFQDVTQTAVSSLNISSIGFLPSPSMIVIQ